MMRFIFGCIESLPGICVLHVTDSLLPAKPRCEDGFLVAALHLVDLELGMSKLGDSNGRFDSH